jgi:spore germination protein KC/spore germination protein
LKKTGGNPAVTRVKISKSALLILNLALLPLLLAGCWDRKEINDVGITLATAVDKEDNGLYRVTLQLPLPGQMSEASGGGGGTGGGKTFYIDSATGRTILEADYKLQTRISRSLIFSHRRVLIVGERLAREGIHGLFDVASRLAANRLTAYIVVAQGRAYDLLNVEPQFERFSAEAIRELAQAKYAININIKELALDMNHEGSDGIAMVMGKKAVEKAKKKTDEISFLGYAQFRGEKMVDIFAGNSMEGLKWLRGGSEPFSLTIDMPGKGPVSMAIREGSSSITPEIRGEDITFRIGIHALAIVEEDLTNMDLSKTENYEAMADVLATHLHKSVHAAIQKIQDNKADSAQFGRRVERAYPRLWREKLKDQWRDKLTEAKFTVNVKCEIQGLGLISESIVREVTDE